MKKLFILFISLTLTSCFTEPKKSKEKASEVKNITSYEKEVMTLDVLNKLIGFEINDFKDWCKSQNLIYNSSYSEGNVSFVSADESTLISLNIPDNINNIRRISYRTTFKNEYEKIFNTIENSGYSLESKTDEVSKYYNQNKILTISIIDNLEEDIYSITLEENN